MAPSAYLLGGVQAWLDYLVPGLEAAGWQVTVLLVHGIHSDAHRYLRQHPFSRVRLVENPTGTHEGRVRALCEVIRAVDPDLVLAVNIVDSYEAVARLRRRKNGGPKVAMALHGLHSSFQQDIGEWSAVLDGVIATNRLAAAAVIDGGLPQERVRYAPCGVLIPDLTEPRQAFDKLTLLYAGRFDDAEKRVLDLPKILRALDRRGMNFSLGLAGSGPDEAALRNALLEFGERVEFLGVLGEKQLQDSFFRPGAIALVLSPSETGPLVAWEAMANGVAVVSSRFVGMGLEDSLRDGETCLSFAVGDTEAAATAIARLADPALRQSLARAGHEMVRKRYNRATSVHAWDTALRGVLDQDSLPACPTLASASNAGRMDRFLGKGKAESLRRLLGLRFRHAEAGGEWPHSYGADNDEEFLRKLVQLDQSTPSRNEQSSMGAQSRVDITKGSVTG